jgi:hypothetical protein
MDKKVSKMAEGGFERTARNKSAKRRSILGRGQDSKFVGSKPRLMHTTKTRRSKSYTILG